MPKLNPYDFGKRLIDTNDLDPVYVVLWKAQLDHKELQRWLLAYWCFYHSGTASWIVDRPGEFWLRMETAAASKDWPRCSERRHFRGKAATDSIAYLESQGVSQLFDYPTKYNRHLEDIMREVQTWVGFGPWIAFKVADMLERLGLADVEFSTGPIFLFKSPKEGADLMWERYGKGPEPEHKGEWAVKSLLRGLGPRLAPPRQERVLGVQEAETVLCKWKSYLNGHYKIGEDIEGLKI